LIFVLDASTVVSAALKQNSVPERVLLRAVDDPHRVILSQEVEDEYREVMLRPKFDRFVSIERRRQIVDIVIMAAARIEPTESVRVCPDANDDKYLAMATAGHADIIVSGASRHLLPLNPWRGISILSPAACLALI
jgi:putative PIN family toxin of toxin-antitoxin system